jgi:hypothetical protein
MNKILKTSFESFNYKWDLLQSFLIENDNSLYEITDDLDLSISEKESLGNLNSVESNIVLGFSKIKSHGNLSFVGGDLDIRNTPLSISFSEEEIHKKVQVKGSIILY